MSPTAITMGVLFVTALPGSIAARAGTTKPTITRLQEEIRQRDTLIRSLVRRVENLERRMVTGDRVSASPTSAAKRPPVNARVAAAPAQTEIIAGRPEDPVRAPARPANQPPGSPAGATRQAARTNPPGPEQFEVSEETAERALERTLAATGNLLVPSGFAEVEPIFGYTRRENPSLVLFNLDRNEFNWALGMRFGLPRESQFEIALPYNLVHQQLTDIFVAPAQQVSSRSGNGIGDLTVGLAKTFLHESGWVPDLLGRISYEAPTGPITSNQVPMPTGQNKLSFAATALKRQDPLVFTATAGYTKAFQSNHINPGDQINFQTGAFLATSPETTLRGVLQQNFLQDTTVDNVTFKGSNSAQSILTFGASSILGRDILADLQVGIGLTNSAPKYSVIFSSTYRFGVPGL
jgi:Putative MetA-pathway of phenol degradation